MKKTFLKENIRWIILSIILMVVLIALTSFIWIKSSSSNNTSSSNLSNNFNIVAPSVPIEKSTGEKVNPLVIVEVYEDFQCPYCYGFDKIFDLLISQYNTRSVKFVFHHYPLVQLHPYAHQSAQAAEYAASKGKFWEYKKAVFDAMSNYYAAKKLGSVVPLTTDDLVQYGVEVGLDGKELRYVLENRVFKDVVDLSIQNAQDRKVRGTPTVFINNKEVDSDNLNREDLSDEIYAYLKSEKPVVKNTERLEWQAKLKWSDECEKGYQARAEVLSGSGIDVYNLDNNKKLIRVFCEFWAYQGMSKYYVYDETMNKSTELKFKVFTEIAGSFKEGSESEMVGLDDYDPQSRKLTVHRKYAGYGCGMMFNYVLVDDAFELKEARYGACTPDLTMDVSKWKLIYPKQ